MHEDNPNVVFLEQVVLGAILKNDSFFSDILEYLDADSFVKPLHQQIFRAMNVLAEIKRPVDILTVDEILRYRGAQNHLAYLAELANNMACAANVVDYAKSLKTFVDRRKLDEKLDKLKAMNSNGETLETIYALAEQDLHNTNSSEKSDGIMLSDAMTSFLDALETPAAKILTGLIELDLMLDGMHPGELLVLGARPGIGKTTLAINIIKNVLVSEKLPVLFFSLEMGVSQITKSLICCTGKVPLLHLRSTIMPEHTYPKLSYGIQALSNAKLQMITNSYTINAVKLAARRFKSQFSDCGLIVIDYLQLMSTGKDVANRNVELGTITRELKLLAKELDTPILALSQMSRDSDKTKREPKISDLRDSGCIEADADVVMLMARDASSENFTTIYVGKNRNGNCGNVNLLFDGSTATFRSNTRDDYSV